MISVAEKLFSEIERVSAKRERWCRYQAEMGNAGLGMGLTIQMMTIEIDAAKSALLANARLAREGWLPEDPLLKEAEKLLEAWGHSRNLPSFERASFDRPGLREFTIAAIRRGMELRKP